ncbi:MAG: CHASE domain-containing protein [Pseudomonadota bacterium]
MPTIKRSLGRPARFSPRAPALWLGLILSLGVGAIFHAATATSVESDAKERFDTMARNAQATIEARIKNYTDVLRGSASMFEANESISRAAFHRYVAGLDLARHFPGIETINFARTFSEAERVRVEAEIAHDGAGAEDGYPPFAIQPPGRRDSYSALVYIEPIGTWGHKLGLDLHTRPSVAAALDLARDTGTLSSSGLPLDVFSGPNRNGLAMRLPIYRSGMPTTSVAERRAAFIGSVGMGLSIDRLVQGVLDAMPARHARLTMVHHGADKDTLLYDSAATLAQPDPPLAPASSGSFVKTLPIDFNGRPWQGQFSVDKDALFTGFDVAFPWLAGGAGFVTTMLLYALFHTLASSRQRALQMAREMTRELRTSQSRLELSHEKLRQLAAHADQIKEDERKRIAREIHDDLGQNLLALRIEADILAARTGARAPRLHARALATVAQIDSTIRSVRQIINDLRPNVLDLGLSAAVDWQIADFRRRTGIACELIEAEDELEVDDHCATAFFRILQESLSNIVRHAQASHVQVRLRRDDATLMMTVSDNGRGMAAAGRHKAGSFGLVGIEERIKLLGGTFAVTSNPGMGTYIHVTVPLRAGSQHPIADLAIA